jgi:hypothetical protein
LLAFIISSARLFAAAHTAPCDSAFTQGEAARAESFALRGGVGVGKEFCVSLAIAEKENRVAFAAHTINKATIIVRDVNAIQFFLNIKILHKLNPTQSPFSRINTRETSITCLAYALAILVRNGFLF